MKTAIAQNGRPPALPKEGFQKEMTAMNQQQIRKIALQASGEYLMKHIAGIIGIVEDKRSRNKESVLNEGTLVAIEAQVKAIAEELVHQSRHLRRHPATFPCRSSRPCVGVRYLRRRPVPCVGVWYLRWRPTTTFVESTLPNEVMSSHSVVYLKDAVWRMYVSGGLSLECSAIQSIKKGGTPGIEKKRCH